MLWMSVSLDFHADWAYCSPNKSVLIDAPFKGRRKRVEPSG